MSRTIIDVVSAGGDGEFAQVRESVMGLPDASAGQIINCVLSNGDGGQHTGDLVYQLLTTVPAIKNELDFSPPSGSPPVPLYLSDRAPRAQELPWEMLRSGNQQFLALEKRRPVGRIADANSGIDEQVSEPLYDPPLKVLAVISAAGIDGESEWKQLFKGLKEHEANTPFRLHTLYAEDSVKQAIEAADDPAVTANRLHSDDPLVKRHDDMIERDITAFQPHVLHFFCHGMPSLIPELELATVADKAANRDRGLIKLDAKFFEDLFEEVSSIWCVVLNCCHGATRRESSSMARRLVECGVPVAIGMREAVQPQDANVFCGELYRELAKVLHNSFSGTQTAENIDWVSFLTEPRIRICKQRATINTADQVEEWSFPVIYVQSQPFRLKLQTEGISEENREDLLAELMELRDIKQKLKQAGIDGEAISEINNRILELVDQLSASEEGD